ncbi:MBOAT family protein [Acidocella sp. KAb 2-4]|uniref:MBOAT family O-acyltransferase n=1 Tax=Acidocella sp. KAb 2-4 TaxID=2885158 RepID=UPI001D066CCD|nr:MBOAT family O-acyltransferase [Acidocella sp. KAb 2-4]MCB5943562.1 MBOAT family protein [Acidocella sp. KAb 2-4]
MLFNSRVFILAFLPVALSLYLAAARLGRRAAMLWLLAVSLVFYAWWKPLCLPLLLGSIGTNFLCGRMMLRAPRRRLWLVAGLVFNFALLGVFKYAGLFGVAGIVLPLGISFFTFQQVMFLVDTWRGELGAAPFLDYACFIAFFPHLISGPIVRPGHILPQFAALRPWAGLRARVAEGAELFLLGLAKKMVLADGLARFADPGFAAAARHDPLSLVEAWVALLAYALQIYFDFSGYSDMAIGLARMFGISFPVNFASPYKADNISLFWRRWNITLSFFLRDYLYIPLGGNRRGEARRIANLLITMLLGGLWHGAAWRFLLWGGLHGVYLVLHGWAGRLRLRLPVRLGWALTLFCVLLAWVPFRAAGFGAAMAFYKGLFGGNGVVLPALLVQAAPWLGHVARAVPVLPYLGDARTLSLPQAVLMLALGWWIALAWPNTQEMTRGRRHAALVASVAFSLQALFFAPAAVPFLYFQF